MQSAGVEMRCKDSGKVCLTVREAGEIINSFKRHHNNKTRNGNRPCRKYWCKCCGYYHLTHLAYFGEKRKFRKIVNLVG